MAVTQAEVLAQHGQPASSPDPVSVDRIDDGPDKPAVDEEGEIFPALGQGTGGNGCRRVHEDHLEEKQGEDRDIIDGAGKEETLAAKESELLSEERDGDFMVEPGITAQSADGAQSAEHEGKPADVESEHAQGIDHQVHGHGMSRILGPGKARLHHGESRLHEHDQEAGNQRPDEIDGHPVMTHGTDQFRHGGFTGFCRRDIRGVSRFAARVGLRRGAGTAEGAEEVGAGC